MTSTCFRLIRYDLANTPSRRKLMKRILRLMTTLLSLLVATMPAFGRSVDLVVISNKYKEARTQKNAVDSGRLGKEALVLGEKRFGKNSKQFATLMANLASFYWVEERHIGAGKNPRARSSASRDNAEQSWSAVSAHGTA